jgi:hypothetical protein
MPEQDAGAIQQNTLPNLGYANPYTMFHPNTTMPMPPMPQAAVPFPPHFYANTNPYAPYPQNPFPVLPDVEYPDTEHWCEYLDTHPLRNKDGIRFTPYGPILKEKRFLRIKQLSADFVKADDLAR